MHYISKTNISFIDLSEFVGKDPLDSLELISSRGFLLPKDSYNKTALFRGERVGQKNCFIMFGEKYTLLYQNWYSSYGELSVFVSSEKMRKKLLSDPRFSVSEAEELGSYIDPSSGCYYPPYHNESGPALINGAGARYFLHGVPQTFEQHKRFVAKIRLGKIQ